jgi:hypothetical protein
MNQVTFWNGPKPIQNKPRGDHVSCLCSFDDLVDDPIDVVRHEPFSEQGKAVTRSFRLPRVACLKRATSRFRRVFSRRHTIVPSIDFLTSKLRQHGSRSHDSGHFSSGPLPVFFHRASL